jgi:hypothetical protein
MYVAVITSAILSTVIPKCPGGETKKAKNKRQGTMTAGSRAAVYEWGGIYRQCGSDLQMGAAAVVPVGLMGRIPG